MMPVNLKTEFKIINAFETKSNTDVFWIKFKTYVYRTPSDNYYE